MPRSYSKPRYRPSRPVHSVGKGYVSNIHQHGELLGIKMGVNPRKKRKITLGVDASKGSVYENMSDAEYKAGLKGGFDPGNLIRIKSGGFRFKDGRNFATGYERTKDGAYEPYRAPSHDFTWYLDPRNPINEGFRRGNLGEVLGGFAIGGAEAAFLAGLASLAAAGISAAGAASIAGTAEGVELTGLLGRAALAAEEGGAVSNTFQSAARAVSSGLRNRGGFSYRI